MEAFFKAQGLKGAILRTQLERLGLSEMPLPDGRGRRAAPGEGPSADSAASQHALAFDPSLDADLAWHVRAWRRWVLARARADLGRFYPTIDGKPTVAYLWARTVKCKNCRATIPLLKTKWLSRKEDRRVVLKLAPNAARTAPIFKIASGDEAAAQGGNGAQRREYDKKLGARLASIVYLARMPETCSSSANGMGHSRAR
jgi:putative DNA methylase